MCMSSEREKKCAYTCGLLHLFRQAHFDKMSPKILTVFSILEYNK